MAASNRAVAAKNPQYLHGETPRRQRSGNAATQRAYAEYGQVWIDRLDLAPDHALQSFRSSFRPNVDSHGVDGKLPSGKEDVGRIRRIQAITSASSHDSNNSAPRLLYSKLQPDLFPDRIAVRPESFRGGFVDHDDWLSFRVIIVR